MAQLLNITDIKALYPNEWVLLGNPVMDDSKIDVNPVFLYFIVKTKKKFVISEGTKLQTLTK